MENIVVQCKLGNIYYDGEGGYKDLSEAIKWYRLAAGQGHALAQENLDAIADAECVIL